MQPILSLSVVRSNRVPVELSHAGPAWWRTQETTGETREMAAIPPVYRRLSRTRNVGPACLCARFLALVSCCRGCVGAPGLLPSVPVLFVGLVPSCGSCPHASSVFVSRVCFKNEATTQGTDPKTGFSDRPTTCRAGSRWWSGIRSDDPRTDRLTGWVTYHFLSPPFRTLRRHRYRLLRQRFFFFFYRSWRARMAPDGHH